MRQYQIVLVDRNAQDFTAADLASSTGVHAAFIERLVELGHLTPIRKEGRVLFHASAVARVRSICRLRQDLGINLAGISVVLDLLDKIRALRRENDSLRIRR